MSNRTDRIEKRMIAIKECNRLLDLIEADLRIIKAYKAKKYNKGK